MGMVGGSRHYGGGGLGDVGVWGCPACGAEHATPIAQGCPACGAGKPGHRVEVGAPPPAAATAPAAAPIARQGDVATHWAAEHPDVTIEAAYRAGYQDGVRAVRAAQRPAPPPDPPLATSLEARQLRTLIAALEFFRGVLAEQPEEVTTGEWCSVDELTALVNQLKQQEAQRV